MRQPVHFARTTRWSLLCGAMLALAWGASASAAVGTLDASVIECQTLEGEPHAIVEVAIAGAPADTAIWLLVTDPRQTLPPTPFSAGTTDAGGAFTTRLDPRSADGFPFTVSAQAAGEKGEPIGEPVSVEFACPASTPIEALQDAVDSGALTADQARPLASLLEAASALEARGMTRAAVTALRISLLQVDVYIRIGWLTEAEAGPLIEAVHREIARLGAIEESSP
ncbi:MAG: hypothetical protein ACRDPC_07120 [Solirubrobacteraceae bacterium]